MRAPQPATDPQRPPANFRHYATGVNGRKPAWDHSKRNVLEFCDTNEFNRAWVIIPPPLPRVELRH